VAQSDHDTRVAASPYAAAVTHAAETERMVGELRTALKRGAAATAAL
jgi:hypothetical protein